ncbi:MAG TPA: class I SAM-dependent methyltransferase [Pirellulales bacterium]|jgi:ubiquinone/menaquinone biosynthesis C-methylase UbiE|nr:class I SAM-dependent methyltransferase [Pirellulales bacterium]
MIPRCLEPEVMDSEDDASDYDAIDHREVNRRFVEDLRAAGPLAGELLDLGTGTALIPIALCQICSAVHVLAVDLAESMLELGRKNVGAAGLQGSITLERVDCKQLPYESGRFAGVISNSIVHHIPEPRAVLAEAARVVAPGGLLFVRDLMRPESEAHLAQLVERYTVGSNDHQRRLFADSLRAALSLDEIRELVGPLGYSADTVQPSSDRHWTWSARAITIGTFGSSASSFPA